MAKRFATIQAILDTQKTKIVRTASDPVPAWRAENAAIGESQPSFPAVA